MMKAKTEMRANYKRADFTKLERGKFFEAAVKPVTAGLIDVKPIKPYTPKKAEASTRNL
jgi:hypothetical protein